MCAVMLCLGEGLSCKCCANVERRYSVGGAVLFKRFIGKCCVLLVSEGILDVMENEGMMKGRLTHKWRDN